MNADVVAQAIRDLTPPDPRDILEDIDTELYMALNNGALVVGQKVHPIDREHVEKAAILVKVLLQAMRRRI